MVAYGGGYGGKHSVMYFYLYFGLDWWLGMLAGAVYNIGFNSSVVLWGGAFVKTPIDLMTTKRLLVIPKLLMQNTIVAPS